MADLSIVLSAESLQAEDRIYGAGRGVAATSDRFAGLQEQALSVVDAVLVARDLVAAPSPTEAVKVADFVNRMEVALAEGLSVHDIRPTLGELQAFLRVEMSLNGAWVDVTADVLALGGSAALVGQFGISGNGPQDRLADLGVLQFGLNNSENNSAGLRGYYSPGHASCRAGFRHGSKVRVTYSYAGLEWPRFYGKIASIAPTSGSHGARQTQVIVHDLMDDLIETDLRNVTLQVSKTEAQLIATLIAALPVMAQPVALALGAGLDTAPYAFDQLGAGQKAIGPLADLAISSLGYVWMNPTGILKYENRQARETALSSYTFDNDMLGLLVPTTLESVFNHVRATFHPKTVDAAATTVLYALPVASATQPSTTSIDPGATIELWGDYFNPANTQQKIGGTAQVTPVYTGTPSTSDYLANTLADGTGTNKSASIVVAIDAFASTTKFTITNTDAGIVYVTKLQVRGKGLYDQTPLVAESVSDQPYGDRVLNLDLLYQSDSNVTQDLADYLRTQFEALNTQAYAIEFEANRSHAFMLAALGAEIGNRLTISEAQTGLTLADTFINSIRLSAEQTAGGGVSLRCRFGLSAATFFGPTNQLWILDDPALSLLGTSTYLGFA